MSKMSCKHIFAAAALAGALALPTGSAQAQNMGEYLFNKLLGQDTDEPAINYSEKAPLVMPKSRELPQPMSKVAITEDPNWPKDPDAEKRKKKASAQSVGPASSNTELASQEELAKGTRAGPPTNQKTAYEVETEYKRMSNPVNPKVLARRGNFGPDEAPLDPATCPPRRTLVDPPGCINRPLASAPLDANAELPSEVAAEQNKPWYQKVWKFGGGGD